MSVAPNAGIVDLDNFLPPTAGTDGLQGQVPKPLAGQQDYVLTASGWVALSSLGTLIYQGTWNASTNTPTLTSSVGTAGYYYVVSVAGNTDLNGVTTWTVGDWALFNGSVWQKIEGGSTVDITGGQINNTVIGNNTPAAGTFTTLTATGQTSLGGVAGSESFRAVVVSGQNSYVEARGGVYGTSSPAIVARNAGAGAGFNIANGNQGTISFFTNDITGQTAQFRISHTASAVNFVQVTGSATTKGTVISSQGSDSNISSVFQSKGTGAINLAAGSSGVNISNGGTVTAITRTSAGSNYTSMPSMVISAPTTAGGVQATATPYMAIQAGPTLGSGGTGYSANDVLSISGATGTLGTITVNTVTAGVITTFTLTAGGAMSAVPSATVPVSFTGGTGTGATFNILYQMSSSGALITNAGSGYVEQPTVTFSGGGGSGAAAYATVGSIPTVKSVGSALSFATPSGEAFRVSDIGTTLTTTWVETQGGTTSSRVFANAASGNIDLRVSSRGTGVVGFYTNANANLQMTVAHTASAVNYVQVTGAATGGRPTISAQGSDSSVGLNIYAKGGGSMIFSCNGTVTALQLNNTSSGVNYLQMAGAVAGSGPVLSTAGGDTNIDLTLTPKGTGLVRFGTRTASADAAITGYIEIKDSGGTTRRLAIIG